MATLADGDFDSMVEYLLRRAASVRRVVPPIDLFELARLQRVTVVDFRPMLPTGGLSCKPSGFVIYLQDLNRHEPLEVATGGPEQERPALTKRQRFTFAHEIAHTLLFSDGNPPQLRPDSPKSSKLEALCHRAARRMLIPDALVKAEIAKNDRVGAAEVVALARIFDVSPEVALWRCSDLAEIRDSDRALLYVRESTAGERDEIAGFFCSGWFQDRRGRPDLGMSPSSWLSSLVDDDFWNHPEATSISPDGEIRITRVPFKGSAYFIELQRHRTESMHSPLSPQRITTAE